MTGTLKSYDGKLYPLPVLTQYTVDTGDKEGCGSFYLRFAWDQAAAELLGQAAKEVHAYVSIGVSERGEDSATLYNSNLVFSPEGELLSAEPLPDGASIRDGPHSTAAGMS